MKDPILELIEGLFSLFRQIFGVIRNKSKEIHIRPDAVSKMLQEIYPNLSFRVARQNAVHVYIEGKAVENDYPLVAVEFDDKGNYRIRIEKMASLVFR